MDGIETEATLWRWQSPQSATTWHFLSITGPAADAIRFAAITGQWLDGRKGFGSAKVQARIGDTSWRTSVFPDKSSGGWLLPVKKAVRAAEGLDAGDKVKVRLHV